MQGHLRVLWMRCGRTGGVLPEALECILTTGSAPRPHPFRMRSPGATRRFRMVPMPSIQLSSTWPGCRNRGGVRAAPTPAGRAGEDEVARQQRQHRRQLGHEAWHAEDEVAGARVLHRLAVDGAAQRQVVGIGELVGRHHPGPDGSEAPVRLAQRELTAGGALQRALGDVLADRDPGDVGPPVGLGHPVGAAPMTTTSSTSQSVVGAGISMSPNGPLIDAGNLVNVAGTGGAVAAGLGGVRPVVEADGEDLAGRGHRWPEQRLVERDGDRPRRTIAAAARRSAHRSNSGWTSLPNLPPDARSTSMAPSSVTTVARPARLASFMGPTLPRRAAPGPGLAYGPGMTTGVRAYRPEDRAAVRRICFETGLHG